MYLSPQAHHCIHKALRIIGLEDVQIRLLELDENSKINTDYLTKVIQIDRENGLFPFLAIASAGTTDTGAIDPLEKIGRIAKEANIWYHIDGAYGGFFILSESVKHRFDGIELADSIIIDWHKMLMVPALATSLIFKNENDDIVATIKEVRKNGKVNVYFSENCELERYSI